MIFTLLRLLSAAAVALALSLPSSTSSAPVTAPEASLKRPGCPTLYTRHDFRQAAGRALRAPPYTRREKRRLKRLARCQHNPAGRPRLRRWFERKKQAYRVRTMSPRPFARYLLRPQPGQFRCLDALVMRESEWNVYATNPSSGAYGIPQALPGWKMGTHGSDWRTNGRTQVRWMLSYVRGRYGTACGALGHSHRKGWY